MRRKIGQKRPLVYTLFVVVLLFFLGNEWLLIIFQQQSSSTSLTSTAGLPTIPWEATDFHHNLAESRLPKSYVHCVGENFLPNTWIWKSCQFHHLCWEPAAHKFILHTLAPRQNMTRISPYARSSTDPWTHQVSVSALQPAWIAEQRYQWFPEIVVDTAESDDDDDYDQVNDAVWIPMAFDPALLQRPSSILFDILLPIYTLASLFGWEDRPILLTPMNASVCFDNQGTLPSSSCYPDSLQPYLDLIHLAPLPTITTTRPLCARRAAAGVGGLSDHGHKRHGERPADYQTSHNVGKGPLFWKFRQYLLENAGIVEGNVVKSSHHTPPSVRLVLASMDNSTTLSFPTQMSYLQQNITADTFTVQQATLDGFSLRDRLTLAVYTSFWIARVGEASIPAFFLPRGGTLILYYQSRIIKTNRPVMWHWDLWNHASHLVVHWLPEETMDTPGGLRLLHQIVQIQLDYLRDEDADDSVRGDSPATQSKAFGQELTWVPNKKHSSAQCLGDNFVRAQSPAYRSCQYRNLCLDVPQQQLQLTMAEQQNALQESLEASNDGFRDVATDLNQTIMEGRNVRFTQNTPWAPSVVPSSKDNTGFYSLPPDVLWVPYTLESAVAANLGHLCWDFFLPFFTLLAMYGHDQNKRLVLTSLDDGCRRDPKCGGLVRKFIPLMGVEKIYSLNNVGTQGGTAERICARHAAAGIGMLTDHGSTRHGQTLDDYQRVQNAGRGAHFYAFRNFMLRNLGIDEGLFPKRDRHGVLFSVNSSTSLSRRKSFEKQIAAAHIGLDNKAVVGGVEFARFPLHDQVQAILKASVLVSAAGGSTATAMFLPRHSSLILFFETDGATFVGRSRKKDFPPMLDFDFWNNASYLRVHWLPTGSMDEPFHLEFLVDLIRSELAQTESFRMLDEQ
eukprot:scaffold6506_cov171-Amphora_coffeaeformis.AAC.16